METNLNCCFKCGEAWGKKLELLKIVKELGYTNTQSDIQISLPFYNYLVVVGNVFFFTSEASIKAKTTQESIIMEEITTEKKFLSKLGKTK